MDSLDDDLAAVEPLAARVVEVVLRDDDGQDGHARVLINNSVLMVSNSQMTWKSLHIIISKSKVAKTAQQQ